MWSCGYALWVALTNPFGKPVEELPGGGFRYERGFQEIIVQVSNTSDLAENWITMHKWELTQNLLLMEDWGGQSTRNMKDGLWTAEDLRLLNGAEIYSKGERAQIRGYHPTQVIVDDLENRKQAANPTIREGTLQYFFADLHGALLPESKMIVVGTLVHPEGLLKRLYDRDIKAPAGLENSPLFKTPYKKYLYKALSPENEPIAREFWSYEALMFKKAELYSQGLQSVWFAEYMNEPKVGENPIFIDQFFTERNHYDGRSSEFLDEILPNCTDIILFMDVAGVRQKERNDYDAIVGIAFKRSKRPKIYVLPDIKKFRARLPKKVDTLLKYWHKWGGGLYFEDVVLDSIVETTVEDMIEEAGYDVKVEAVMFRNEKVKGKPAPKRLDKVGKAQRIVHFFTNRQVYFDLNDVTHQDIIHDLTTFPEGVHDDTVDALCGCLWVAQDRIKHLVRKEEPNVGYAYDPETGRPIMTVERNPLATESDLPFEIE